MGFFRKPDIGLDAYRGGQRDGPDLCGGAEPVYFHLMAPISTGQIQHT